MIPNAVPRSEFDGDRDSRAELGIPPDAPVVGLVAMLRPQKALEVLIDATALLRSRFPDLRLAQQEMAAFYSEMFGYPTREEIDDVHRVVTELRRELRKLQRASRDVQKKEPPSKKAPRARKGRV